MRAFIVVGASPWVTTCGGSGAFRFRDVPAGRYRLQLWHEMGAPATRDVKVEGKDVDLGTLVLDEGPNAVTANDRELVCVKGCEPWPLVLDRISVTLPTSLEAAQRPGSAGRAVPLVQDAFYRDFEASGMGTAVRVHLGRDRAARIEDLFRKITETTRDVVAGAAGSPSVIDPTREALLSLSGASEELNRKGVTERSRIFADTSPAFWVEGRTARTARPKGSSPALRGVLAAMLLLSLLTVLAVRFRTPGRRVRILPGDYIHCGGDPRAAAQPAAGRGRSRTG
jgi:high-affinity iron transporter